MTFDAWRTLVKLAYQGGEPTTALLMRTVADGARAVTVREVESDLPLAKSYRDSYRDGKVQMAGARITDPLPTVKTTVRGLMPIDDDTEAISAIIDNAIEGAYDDFNGVADRWDALLNEAAVELQRHVPFFQSRHENTYLLGTTGLTSEAFISRVAPPDGMRLSQMYFARYIAPLAEGVAYVADDEVESNDRIYKCVVGGTLTSGQLGAGLTSTDYSDEAIGDLTFRFIRPVLFVPARSYPWVDRARLRAGRFSGGALYSLSDQADELWFYPPLSDGEHQFLMEWVGMKESWGDADEVTFDAKAAACAAHFIRSSLLREIAADGPKSAAEFALYQRELRGCVLDNEQREQGMSSQVAAYSYWGSCIPGCDTVRICTGSGGTGSATSVTSGFSTSVTTLDLLAAVPTVNLAVPVILSFWNDDTDSLVTYRLIAGTDAEDRPGIVRPSDFNAASNAKVWVAAA